MTAPQVLNRNQVRELDRRAIEEFGVPGIVLMENAGRGVAEFVASLVPRPPTAPVVICCGKGNNAGDGFVIARHLDNRGIPVEILLFAEPGEIQGDAATNLAIVQNSGIEPEEFTSNVDDESLQTRLARAACLVDALLGTGARGAPRPPLDRVIRAMNASGKRIVAVDLPSGLDCDSGEAPGEAICAAHTCTFVAPKPGLLLDRAREFVGQLHVIDIGAPRKLVEEVMAK
jgi:NAD(P)H-hydrate epimerase